MPLDHKPSIEDCLAQARDRLSVGDVDRAAAFYTQAIGKAEQSFDKELLLRVLKEAIEFYETERMDQKLLATVERLMLMVKGMWPEKDVRYLPYLDHMSRAFFRNRSYDKLERNIIKALDVQRAVSGEKSEAYATRLEYAANLLVDAGKKKIAESYKARCREIRASLKTSPPPQPKGPGKPLMADRRVSLGLIIGGSGVIPSPVYHEHSQSAATLGMSVGEVMVGAGLLTQEQLYMLLQLQSMVLADKMSIDSASKAFRVICKEGASMENVLSEHNLVNHHSPEEMNRLGRILESAGLLTEDILIAALKESEASKTQLGKHLVLKGIVQPTLVAQALELQKYVRNGNISREVAVSRLKSLSTKKVPGLHVKPG